MKLGISFSLLKEYNQGVHRRLENPGKSLNWKKNSRTGKSFKICRSP
jgi:hypothetical protein